MFGGKFDCVELIVFMEFLFCCWGGFDGVDVELDDVVGWMMMVLIILMSWVVLLRIGLLLLLSDVKKFLFVVRLVSDMVGFR